MYVSVNKKNEIKEVGISTDMSLTSLYVDENNEDFPFKGWSDAKICCYKVEVKDGIITMFTPYIDSRLVEHFDQLGKDTEYNASGIAENSDGLFDIATLSDENSESIFDLAEYISELEARVAELEGGK